MDEPTSALDPAGRADMLGLVAAMRGRRTVIFSSHILADVQRIADQVGILRDGRLLYQGGTQQLIDDYLRAQLAAAHRRRRGPGGRRAGGAAVGGQRSRPAEPGSSGSTPTSIEAGERGIPAVVAACGARQVSCEPVAADLESAFLALTGAVAGAA